jgi:hypothetical protein
MSKEHRCSDGDGGKYSLLMCVCGKAFCKRKCQCQLDSDSVVLTASDSELIISFILPCFPWFILLTLTAYVHRMNTYHPFHVICPYGPARALPS